MTRDGVSVKSRIIASRMELSLQMNRFMAPKHQFQCQLKKSSNVQRKNSKVKAVLVIIYLRWTYAKFMIVLTIPKRPSIVPACVGGHQWKRNIDAYHRTLFILFLTEIK